MFGRENVKFQAFWLRTTLDRGWKKRWKRGLTYEHHDSGLRPSQNQHTCQHATFHVGDRLTAVRFRDSAAQGAWGGTQQIITFVQVVLKTASSFTGARSPPMGFLRCTCTHTYRERQQQQRDEATTFRGVGAVARARGLGDEHKKEASKGALRATNHRKLPQRNGTARGASTRHAEYIARARAYNIVRSKLFFVLCTV